jgi:hypothetical protein
MGISVSLVSTDGEVIDGPIHDSGNVLGKLLPKLEDESSHTLRYIDPYGDTFFNALQMSPFLAEWGRLERKELDANGAAVIDSIERLAKTCSDGPHLYLKFEGD